MEAIMELPKLTFKEEPALILISGIPVERAPPRKIVFLQALIL
jgi:hypothetical protein